MRFFWKIRKFTVFSTKLTIISINLCRKIRKIGFLPNKYEFSQIISTNNCMWIDISAIAKTIISSTQTEVEIFHKLFFCKTIHNYCRKHWKFAKVIILHNRIQTSEKFSPIISKIGIFSIATPIVQHSERKLLTHKLSKASINCS